MQRPNRVTTRSMSHSPCHAPTQISNTSGTTSRLVSSCFQRWIRRQCSTPKLLMFIVPPQPPGRLLAKMSLGETSTVPTVCSCRPLPRPRRAARILIITQRSRTKPHAAWTRVDHIFATLNHTHFGDCGETRSHHPPSCSLGSSSFIPMIRFKEDFHS